MPVIEATKYDGLGPDIYDARVMSIEVKQAKAGGDYLRIVFAAEEGGEISGNTAYSITPGNKTGRWYTAITGTPIVEGTRYDLDDLLGKRCRIVVELNPEGYPKVASVTGPKAPKAVKNTTEQVVASEAPKTVKTAPVNDVVDNELPF